MSLASATVQIQVHVKLNARSRSGVQISPGLTVNIIKLTDGEPK
jgi:hypothetical protein